MAEVKVGDTVRWNKPEYKYQQFEVDRITPGCVYIIGYDAIVYMAPDSELEVFYRPTTRRLFWRRMGRRARKLVRWTGKMAWAALRSNNRVHGGRE